MAAHPHIRLGAEDATTAAKVNTLFIQENARRGVILATGFMFNCAHGEAEVEQTAAVVRESFAVIAEGLERGTLDELLEVPPQEDLFPAASALKFQESSSAKTAIKWGKKAAKVG